MARKYLDPRSIDVPLLPPIRDIDDMNQAISLIEEFMRDVREALVDNWRYTSEYESDQAGDYTTSGKFFREVVNCTSTGTGTQTITLHAPATEGDEVLVRREGTAPVTIDPDTNTINGSSSLVLGAQYDAPRLKFTGSEWGIQ